MRIGIPQLRRLFAAWRFHRQHCALNHIRSVDRATIKFGRDLVPDGQHGGILIEAAPAYIGMRDGARRVNDERT